jgi:hypothetical protein
MKHSFSAPFIILESSNMCGHPTKLLSGNLILGINDRKKTFKTVNGKRDSFLLYSIPFYSLLSYEFRFYRDKNRAPHIYLFLLASNITLGSRAYFHVDF